MDPKTLANAHLLIDLLATIDDLDVRAELVRGLLTEVWELGWPAGRSGPGGVDSPPYDTAPTC